MINKESSTFETSTNKSNHTYRRDFIKSLAAASILPIITAASATASPETEHHDLAESLKTAEKEADKQLHNFHGTDEEREYAKTQTVINLLGATNFGFGVKELIMGRAISKDQYLSLTYLSAAKYTLSNEEDRHHIKNEWDIGIKATAAISTMVFVAGGLQGGYKKRYEEYKQKKGISSSNAKTQSKNEKLDSIQEDLVMISLMAAGLSPSMTTVGSTGMLKEEVHDLVERIIDLKKENIEVTKENREEVEKALEAQKSLLTCQLITHVANISGILFFGDPPFIAVLNHFGKKGLMWQFKNMMPLALRSIHTNIKNIEEIIKTDPLTNEKSSDLEPSQSTWEHFKDIMPFATKEIFMTTANVVMDISLKPAAGLLLGKKVYDQIETKEEKRAGGFLPIASWGKEKATSIKKLTLGKDLSSAHHQHQGEGAFHAMPSEQDTSIQLMVDSISAALDDTKQDSKAENNADISTLTELVDAIGNREFDHAKYLISHMSDNSHMHKRTKILLKELDEISKLDDARFDVIKELEKIKENGGSSWSILSNLPNIINKNILNFSRVHDSLGGSEADVVMALPFQVMHAPFLAPLLEQAQELSKKYTTKIVNTFMKKGTKLSTETISLVNDVFSYISIWGFSSIADNYLGADLGFKTMPAEKAQIPLASSISGGKNTPIGNMANVNLFSLNENDFKDHIKSVFGSQLPEDILTMIYAITMTRIAPHFKKMTGINLRAPKKKSKKVHTDHH